MSFFADYADKLVFLVCAAMIFVPLEHLLPRVRRSGLLRENMSLDVVYALGGWIAITALSALYIGAAVHAFDPLIPDGAKAFVGTMPIWLQVIVLILLGDFYYYWAHRLFHTVPFLWNFHAVHHSIEHMDWIAAYRTHPVDTAITNSGVVILALLFDFSAAAFAIYVFQFSWHSLLKHSNIKVGWGPLRWIYLTPAYHHWHHANEVEAYDRNFAGQLPVWDLLFGTANMKEKESPAKYGVDDPVPVTILGSLFYPLWRGMPDRERAAGAAQSIAD